MELFFHNKDSLVFPGVSSHLFSNMPMDREFFTTQYGLMFPSSPIALSLLRFLRLHNQEGIREEDMIPPPDKSLAVPFLTNRGTLEVVVCDKDLLLYVVELPPARDDKWIVVSLGDNVKSIAIEDGIAKMGWQDAAAWIDDHAGFRFQQPICVDIAQWKKERAGGPDIRARSLAW